jgi:hypothetical protein
MVHGKQGRKGIAKLDARSQRQERARAQEDVEVRSYSYVPTTVDPASIEHISRQAVGKFFKMVAAVNLGVRAVRVRSG